ncbi:DUF4955 domain-containing protein [Flavivirga amylovorans]|uniref:DUF4955 domain-containing protein n=1 Tax=Flavivirga amylovorans TaxID=870486 RepID=A0ABT8WZH6_9FLAO|nr:DUF4955 domain-containing protein [Flavivirga amylovorans]MDO5987080.1 DUF4955 domain-containing protein [Flavivirga amylovorans]
MNTLFTKNVNAKNRIVFILVLSLFSIMEAQEFPKILSDKQTSTTHYLPDFSYAGYEYGEQPISRSKGKIILATDFGVIPNDGLDDTKALKKAMEVANKTDGTAILQLPAGRIILSEILYVERSHFVLRGTGTGVSGSEIYFPRPLMYVKDPEDLKELREYLIKFDKRQREKENNIDLPFSQYAWSGGFIWTRVPGVRVKSYLKKYERPYNVLAKVHEGKRGDYTFTVSDVKGLKKGDVVVLQLFNKQGEKGIVIKDLYKGCDVKVGSHHWMFPDLPIVRQQVEIVNVSKNKITIKTPLTIDVKPEYEAQLSEWKHLEQVGIEHIKLTFTPNVRIAHHVERGNNGIFLTRVFNSWVNDIVIENADSGILTEEIANVTIQNITLKGTNIAHYTVAMAGVHNILAQNIRVYNKAEHPLSFNTFSTKNVYHNCEVFRDPILDQHSGANHQNLFDKITVHVLPSEKRSYPLFAGGGAPYWKPSHGAYNTFWNIKVHFLSGLDSEAPFLLYGMKDGVHARLIGIHGNNPLNIKYEPESYKEFINKPLHSVPSLYEYQLNKRLNKK